MGRPDRPLDPDAGPLADFAADLRALRRRAGNPTYRALAQQAHYSTTTLADAAGGHKLPTLPVLLAYVRACGGDVEAWRTRWHTTAAQLDPSDPALPSAGAVPTAASAQPATSPLADGPQTAGDLGRVLAAIAQQRKSMDAAAGVDEVDEERAEPAPADIPASPAAVPSVPTASASRADRDAAAPGERPEAVRARLPLRPRLGLAPLLLVLAIATTAALLGSHAGPAAPRVQTKTPDTVPTRAPHSLGPVPVSSAPHPSGTAGGTASPSATAAGGEQQVPVGAASPSAAVVVPRAAPAAQTITVGPSCGTMTRSGSWYALAGSDTGCGAGYYRKQTGVQAKADWIFAPGAGKSCSFAMAIPDSPTITSANAEFQLYDATVHSHLLARQYLDQAGRRGGSIVLSPGTPTATGTYDLQIYDDSDTKTTEYAGTVVATCG